MVATVVLALLSALAVGASGVAMGNAMRCYRDVRGVLSDRKEKCPRAKADPLAIFTREEVEALATSPRRSWVRGTRAFGRQCPDPWAEDFQVEEHLWAVHANRLREMASAGTVVVEVVIVLAGGFLGVLFTRLAEGTPDVMVDDGPGVAVSITLLVVALAAMAKGTLLREWQAAADRYRLLAMTLVGQRLIPDTGSGAGPAGV